MHWYLFQKYIWVWLDFKSGKILIKYIIIFAFKHTVQLSGFRRVAQTVSVAYLIVANLVSSIWRKILRKIIMVPEFPEYNPIYTPCPYIKGSWAKIKNSQNSRLKRGNSGENPLYGIGISCKYMHVYLYIVSLLHIKCHEIMLFNRSSADKLHITIINTGNSSKWEKIY